MVESLHLPCAGEGDPVSAIVTANCIGMAYEVLRGSPSEHVVSAIPTDIGHLIRDRVDPLFKAKTDGQDRVTDEGMASLQRFAFDKTSLGSEASKLLCVGDVVLVYKVT